jgi:predicted TIM-barrel fold metal-dependent hydrolase
MKTNPHRKSNGYNRGGATRIIDADGHVRETDEQIMEYMSAGYRSRRDAMLYFPLVPHHGWHRSIPANDFRYQDFRVPDWREWAGKLDEGNIELTVLYPTRFMHIGQIGNPRYAVELCRAYNDFLHEQFLTRDHRFRGMALLPLQDVPSAVKELRRAVKNHGMVGGILPAEGLPFPSVTRCIARFSWKPTVWAVPSRSTRARLYETTIVSCSLTKSPPSPT